MITELSKKQISKPMMLSAGKTIENTYPNRYADATSDFSGTIDGVTVENITAANVERCIIVTGVKNSKKGTNYVKNIVLKNFSLRYTAMSKESPLYTAYLPEYENEYPDSVRFFNLSAFGIWARHTDGLKIENFAVQPPDHTSRSEFVFRDVLNLSDESA